MLDVFRTLVKHLRISIEGPQEQLSLEDSRQFQRSITKTVGEFAGVLPDYHKPDIMNLINSYMVTAADGTVSADPDPRSEWGHFTTLVQLFMQHRSQLAASLVQCLKAVANTYHPAILETTFPDSLFTSLVQLFALQNQSVYINHHIADLLDPLCPY